MKRQTNLFVEIADPSNLMLAYMKARRGKMRKADVQEFERCLDENLQKLSDGILTDSVEIGNYHFFVIHDPKVRQICAAPFSERVLHHAIMNRCHDRFEKHLTHDTYATRKSKGTYAALNKASQYVKKFQWFVKIDIRKYFDSIDHSILKNLLSKLFKEDKLLKLLHRIIDSYQTGNGRGLPIGNLTSQYFANHYLSDADHFAREKLKIRGYLRYMDDMLLFGNDKEELLSGVRTFISFVEKTLKLNFKPLIHQRTAVGAPFLGYKLYPFTIKLNQRSKRRFLAKIKDYTDKLNARMWSEYDYQQHVTPLLAFTQFADTLEYRKNVLKNLEGKCRRH